MNQNSRRQNVGEVRPQLLAHLPHPEPILRVRAFGSLSILGPKGSLGPRDLGGLKAKQLFELLLLSRPASRSKAKLAGDLWDSTLPQNVSATLENYISMLRHNLFNSSISARNVIVTEHDAYRLAPEHVDCDLDTFDRVLTQAEAATLPEEAIQFFDRARYIANGDLLEDEPLSPWVIAWRDHYRRRVVDALLSAAELDLGLGRLGEAEDHAEQAMTMDPLNERAVRAAMHIAVEMGNQHRALAIYERCRKDLGERLGIYPSQQTRALQALIVRQQPLSLTPDPRRQPQAELGLKVLDAAMTDRLENRGLRQSSTRELTASSVEAPGMIDDSTLILLYGACALARKRGGRLGVSRLLDEASILFSNLQQRDESDDCSDLLPFSFIDERFNRF
jgi:DNA-binding SARP family transcriptional activator